MAFQKGHQLNVGRKRSEEVKQKWKQKWIENLPKNVKGNNNPFYGKKHSEKTRKRISEAKKGKKGFKHSEETKRKISESSKGKIGTWNGKKHTSESRKKMSERMKGEKNHNWKGGITPIHYKIRNSLEYKLWRESIFKRDDYICRFCNKRGGRLNADHIKPFADYPELRFAIDNGRTLCIECHKKTDSYGWNKWNNLGKYKNKKMFIARNKAEIAESDAKNALKPLKRSGH